MNWYIISNKKVPARIVMSVNFPTNRIWKIPTRLTFPDGISIGYKRVANTTEIWNMPRGTRVETAKSNMLIWTEMHKTFVIYYSRKSRQKVKPVFPTKLPFGYKKRKILTTFSLIFYFAIFDLRAYKKVYIPTPKCDNWLNRYGNKTENEVRQMFHSMHNHLSKNKNSWK